MATELALERSDDSPIGSFAEVQAIIKSIFPDVQFWWTTSGLEKLRIAAERKIEFPPAIRHNLEKLPSLLEGRVVGDGFMVEFGLGCKDPIWCLYVTPRGDGDGGKLAELENIVGGHIVVSGEEKHRETLSD
jgi:hypothetical protein